MYFEKLIWTHVNFAVFLAECFPFQNIFQGRKTYSYAKTCAHTMKTNPVLGNALPLLGVKRKREWY